uniref:phenylalanine--tRNA ligase n=1 Tax=Thaumatella adunca TaxID=2006976 RepID=A0A1Z1MP58_9FLOR|nr:Phenylalanine-tRNA ligase beta subunit [Thaumatella adunca]ARW67531.1 Phenylalanine-tRNA ligase beta subunit [Thaumatella adunca]
MKFSWKLINSFINLKDINFNEFQEKLTLAGIEIESIENKEEIEDQIIDLSITSNRREIFSTLSLAREISIILNKPLKLFPIKLLNKNNINYETYSHQTFIKFIRIHKMNNLSFNKTPEWLINTLNINQIKHNHLLNNIQEYIYIKWGETFQILNDNNMNEIKNFKEIFKSFNTRNAIKTNYRNNNNLCNSITIMFTISQEINIKNQFQYINNSIDYYENFYIDAIKLISTLTTCTINKSYNLYNEKIELNNIINIKKNDINTVLGNTKNKQFNFLSSKNILNILQQLKFFPLYNKAIQTFTVTIPIYRKHDITRQIDVIEEIGRIYQFKYFFKQIRKNNKKGNKSTTSLKIKKIRYTLRHLGLHEVITSSLTNTQNNSITLYNPITNEQKNLRHTILENLVENYLYNIKYENKNIEIFEIGKIFKKNKKNKYIEKKYLGGLIYNKEYIRPKWSEKPKNINFFHVKGILETFLEQINAYVILKNISENNEIENIHNNTHLLKKNHRLGIYNKNNQNFIGVIGELNTIKITKKRKHIYIFEIDIEELNKAMIKNHHLNNIIKVYSNYPSITRDISIKLKQNTNINKIKENILKTNPLLIESVEIFNEYYGKEKRKESIARFVGLRIIYRAQNRTLNTDDIQYIETNLKQITQQI